MIDEPIQDQVYLGMNLGRFQETCSFASRNEFIPNYDSPKKVFTNSYEESEDMLDQLATNLMKEMWNIP